MRRSSSDGESARLIIVRSRVRVPPPLQKQKTLGSPGGFVVCRACCTPVRGSRVAVRWFAGRRSSSRRVGGHHSGPANKGAVRSRVSRVSDGRLIVGEAAIRDPRAKAWAAVPSCPPCPPPRGGGSWRHGCRGAWRDRSSCSAPDAQGCADGGRRARRPARRGARAARIDLRSLLRARGRSTDSGCRSSHAQKIRVRTAAAGFRHRGGCRITGVRRARAPAAGRVGQRLGVRPGLNARGAPRSRCAPSC